MSASPGRTLVLLWLSAASVAAVAQPGAKPGEVSASASLTGIVQFDTDLDHGGSFHWNGFQAAGTLTRQLTPEFSAGLALRYEYQAWSFDAPNGQGVGAAWSHINAPTIGVNFNYALAPDWSVLVAPSFGWSYDSGASASDGKIYGAAFAAIKTFSPDLVLGLGAGVFRQIDETKVFPFVIVSWKIDERWRIANPFQAGPFGGAGLEAVYTAGDNWDIAGGGTYRSYRFRLAPNAAATGSVGENRAFPLYARLSRNLGASGRIDLYGGILLGGRLGVTDPNGNERTESYKAAPVIGLTLSQRF